MIIKHLNFKYMNQLSKEPQGNEANTLLPAVYPCKKIRAGKYQYRGWVISRVGYYEPEQRVTWEAYDPKTGCADFHGFSKREIKALIDTDLSKMAGNVPSIAAVAELELQNLKIYTNVK
jgi:hypothetical protein